LCWVIAGARPNLRGLRGLLSISDVLEVILHDTDMEVHVLRDHVIAIRGM
jgi:hypothetical protein